MTFSCWIGVGGLAVVLQLSQFIIWCQIANLQIGVLFPSVLVKSLDFCQRSEILGSSGKKIFPLIAEMVMEHHFQEPAVENNLNQDGISLAKWKSLSADGPEDKSSGGLDCNICLDFVQDPVVTFCGHLYCWPCIYKWLHFQSSPSENPNHHQPQCPVCKAELSEESVIPLYGRGLTTKPSEGKAGQLGTVIPQRPPSPKCGSHSISAPATPNISRAVPQLQQFGYTRHPQMLNQYANPGSYIESPSFSLGGTRDPMANHPVIGMLGEMFLARMFGNQTAIYSYPNSYQLIGGNSARIRRQVLQADKSLSRIINFLFCCMILCLLLF